MQIQADTFLFLEELKKNNHREWFGDNKPRYQAIQENIIDFTATLLQACAPFDEKMLDIAPKNCLFRIYKDARFAKGEPYKTHIGVHMVTSGDRSDFGRAGYYLHIEPNGLSMLAGGAHAPTPAWLKVIRENIFEEGDDLLKILQQKSFQKVFGTMHGERLTNPPKGYAKDDPHLDLLKYKTMTVMHHVSDQQVLTDDFLNHCVMVFKTYLPFRDFLNRPSPMTATR